MRWVSPRELQDESGQMLIVGLGIFAAILIAGAIVVDIGLWVSERRGAQTDADLAALAGAWELLDPAGGASEARDAAIASVSANNEQGNSTLDQNIDFNGGCVTLNVEHESNPVFTSIFDIVAPDIGAHAQACAGATNAPRNLIPLQINYDNNADCFEPNGRPKFTALCAFDYGVAGLDPLDLDTSADSCSDDRGNGDVERLVRDGAPGICLINGSGSCSRTPWNDCVGVPNGAAARKKVIDGMEDRIQREGDCDNLFSSSRDGVDQLDETVAVVFDTGNPLTSFYEAMDCDPSTDGKQLSPRLVTIVMLDNAPGSNGAEITAFAALYVAGCSQSKLSAPSQSNLDQDCNAGNNEVVYGQFVNLVVEGSDVAVGAPSLSNTTFSIALTE